MVRGKVKNGKVVLEDPKALPEGSDVEVRPARKARKVVKTGPKKKRTPPQSFLERYAEFIGSVKDLPSDMSINLDHYLYGLPKGE